MEQQRDEKLWKIARKRASFRKHLFTYIAVNGFLWILWFFRGEGMHPWPLYPMLGWGIGLAFNYYDAYHGDTDAMAEREYQKLAEEQRRKKQPQ